MSTVRQTIIDALDARLKAIRVANGYSTNLGASVISWQTDPTPIEDLNPAEVEYRDADVDSSDDLLGVHAHKLAITLEVRTATGTAVADLRSYEADIHKAVGLETLGSAPGHWGGVAIKTEPGKTVIRAEQKGQTAAGLTFEFTITYRTLAWDPYMAV